MASEIMHKDEALVAMAVAEYLVGGDDDMDAGEEGVIRLAGTVESGRLTGVKLRAVFHRKVEDGSRVADIDIEDLDKYEVEIIARRKD